MLNDDTVISCIALCFLHITWKSQYPNSYGNTEFPKLIATDRQQSFWLVQSKSSLKSFDIETRKTSRRSPSYVKRSMTLCLIYYTKNFLSSTRRNSWSSAPFLKTSQGIFSPYCRHVMRHLSSTSSSRLHRSGCGMQVFETLLFIALPYNV